MDAENTNNSVKNLQTPEKVIEEFFDVYTSQEVHGALMLVFKALATRKSFAESHMSEEDVALFFDQLIDLVAAASILHQANRVSIKHQEGSNNA